MPFTPHARPETAAEFRENLAAVRARVDEAALAAGREAGSVRLLPVSKTVEPDRLRLAAEAGATELAENRVQEAVRKHDALADLGVAWAVIGHLQTNKARDVAAVASEFQGLDSLRVAEALDRRLQAAGRGLDVFVQVNTSGEDSKFGLAPDEVPDVLRRLPDFASLRLRGFMTIAANSPDEDVVRGCFRELRGIRDRAREAGLAGAGELSMGMSGDFALAVAEGSDCVRVGQAIFGARPAV
ncbi:YggS family pyridoxal phosphate-dependent enzyme [Microbacterium indicum]|uniref:YggS family pyridoxal phosphate-dependent enzyme n=1 Tax=Microbacterium indicum TaxID=358100 RepID=UPI0003FDE4A9|nr:YggS family pyridoxal phosphate-dependent enzyme [Microbacterium indicum]